MTITVGMIGVGNMASSIVWGLLENPQIKLLLSTRRMETLTDFEGHSQVNLVPPSSLTEELFPHADYIFVGVKPHQIDGLMDSMDLSEVPSGQVWIHMAAGYSLERFEAHLPRQAHGLRIMPNTPVRVGQGYTTSVVGTDFPEEELSNFLEIMSTTGVVEVIDESLINVASGLAGASPAFIYQVIEAMADVGVQFGLKRDQAYRMAAQAVKGAGAMVVETGLHPGVLKDQVTSPGGSTIEGVRAGEEHRLRHAIGMAVEAAILKSQDMSK